ncbi:ArsR/SmtB family transcription factor [Gordonia hankookensis]|uniref:Winged helix-turn-helix transcriptional regulator n=1 Tax=Gordonia hankookensis TaxID=589403 RepID=A0ABR7W9Y5_9ACTN|nr:metalloregulator ArsR/SmtB family transcription factor [Gordonia hankookensis]MBD1318632.1 winged helix-turn-helix transcriptional regulator [Gordonia hankookensis]
MGVFDAIADPVRRRILGILADGPCRVVDITDLLAGDHPISRPAISRHLRILAAADLVDVTERGRERHYHLDPAPLDDVRTFLAALGSRPDTSPGTGPPGSRRSRIDEDMLDALDTEVYRTRRDRRRAAVERQEDSA